MAGGGKRAKRVLSVVERDRLQGLGQSRTAPTREVERVKSPPRQTATNVIESVFTTARLHVQDERNGNPSYDFDHGVQAHQ